MARTFIDGAETGDLALWAAGNAYAQVSAAQGGMSGTYCIELTSTAGYVKTTISTVTEMYTAFKFRPDGSGASSHGIVAFYSGSALQCSLSMLASTGTLQAYTGSSAALGSPSSGSMSIGTTYLVECYVKIADSGGRFIVKVDGVTWLDLTGDTKGSASDSNIDAVLLGYTGSTLHYGDAFYDDIVFDTTAWIGDTKIQGLSPTGPGNSAQWTASAGANWQCVDDLASPDTDWVETNVNDNLDVYAMANLTGNVAEVKCLQVQARSKKEGSATPQNLKLAVRTASTDYLSANNALQTSYAELRNIWQLNPNTSAAWEVSDVNGLEAGIKSAA